MFNAIRFYTVVKIEFMAFVKSASRDAWVCFRARPSTDQTRLLYSYNLSCSGPIVPRCTMQVCAGRLYNLIHVYANVFLNVNITFHGCCYCCDQPEPRKKKNGLCRDGYRFFRTDHETKYEILGATMREGFENNSILDKVREY